MKFIRANLDLTNDRIPDHLLKFWLLPGFTVNAPYRTRDPQVMIFLYIMDLNSAPDQTFDQILYSSFFGLLFYRFQVVLAATAYSRRSHIPIPPFRIFDYAAYALPNLARPGRLMKEYMGIVSGPQD